MMEKKLNITSNNFGDRIQESFKNLRNDQDLFDVTLACEGGRTFQAHKIILSACSRFFKEIFKLHKPNNPFVYIKGASLKNLSSLISFMYLGQVEVSKNDLDGFLSLGKELEVIGLECSGETNADTEVHKDKGALASSLVITDDLESIDNTLRKKHSADDNIDALSFIKVEDCDAIEDSIDCDPFAYQDYSHEGILEFDHNINMVKPESSGGGKPPGFPRNPRTKTSPIWDFYLEDPIDPRKAICQVPTCGKVMSRGKGERKTWTTASLKAHLKVHKIEWVQYRIKCVDQKKKKEEEEIVNSFSFPGYPHLS